MKQILWAFLQLILFLVVFLTGSLLPGFHILPMWSIHAGPGRLFVLDGLLAMLALYLVILAIEAARHHLRTAGRTSTIALLLALALGLLMKFGFITI